ncbi:MAG TPA: prolipoprotein diacylglyceryl transferase family protein [Polyangiaceae bacterium]|nr:prolipoprotein diacylglyceryl transferase family protein [Polyangiaceae bacterium]
MPFHVEPFGLFLALGLVLGVGLSARLGARAGLDRRLGAEGLFGALVGALLFARLLYLLGSRAPASLPLWFALGEGGLSGYGALLGATLGGLLAFRVHGLRRPELDLARGARAWLDQGAIGALVTVAVARLGCYLSGCDFGRPLTARAPGWVARLGTFPRSSSSPVWVEQVLRGELGRDSAFTLPVHPTELYEALGALLLLAALFARRRVQRQHGELFLLAIVGYALLRFTTESLRGDADRGLLLRLSVSQWCALLSAPLSLVALRQLFQRVGRST